MRLPWLALLLPLTLIAGCFGGDDSGGEPTVTPSPTPTPGPTVVRTLEVQDRREVTGVATGIDEFIDVGFEPSVEVAADGTIYVTAARGAGSHGSLLWVSRDNGTTFVHIPFADPATGVSNLPFGAEGDLAVDAASRAYFVDLTLASTTVSRSTDQGRTWEVRNPAAFVVPGGDREWVAAGPEELVAVTWNHLAGESSAPGMWVAVSADGGRTFPTQTVVLDAGGGFAGGIGMGPNGTLVVARIPDDVTAHVSNDRGATFTRSVVHATQGNATYLVAFADVDAAGNLYVAWTEQAGNAS
ncbi:MAG TPA: hypothetical protein VI796_00120, partial [Candidatus Thermoplasmatota archaeon]|nr:hypothetical protein [Candidatus Thermoplasmatota archaeon]